MLYRDSMLVSLEERIVWADLGQLEVALHSLGVLVSHDTAKVVLCSLATRLQHHVTITWNGEEFTLCYQSILPAYSIYATMYQNSSVQRNLRRLPFFWERGVSLDTTKTHQCKYVLTCYYTSHIIILCSEGQKVLKISNVLCVQKVKKGYITPPPSTPPVCYHTIHLSHYWRPEELCAAHQLTQPEFSCSPSSP